MTKHIYISGDLTRMWEAGDDPDEEVIPYDVYSERRHTMAKSDMEEKIIQFAMYLTIVNVVLYSTMAWFFVWGLFP